MTVRRKNYLIGILSLSAAALLAANIQFGSFARADQTIAGDQFQLVTGRTNSGDEALYIIDKTRNLVAIYQWNDTSRGLTVRDVTSLDAMMNSNGR